MKGQQKSSDQQGVLIDFVDDFDVRLTRNE
jgi:hypothetical protein